MANILKVTPPPQEYNNSNTVKNNPITPQDPRIQNIIDPTRVVRPDGKGGSVDEKFQLLNYESNFEGFMQMIKDLPLMEPQIAEFFFTKLENLIMSGMGENFAEEIAKFMELMSMSEGELLTFVKEQADAQTKFQGPFFDVLRQILRESGQPELKAKIMEFLKRFNDVTASDHLMNNIMENLKNISQNMYQKPRDALLDMMERLMQLDSAKGGQIGENPHNSKMLKETILPFIAEYIAKTHDYGSIRDQVTMLTLNMARYENANKDSFLQLFSELLKYSSIQKKLGDMSELGDRGTELLQRAVLETGAKKDILPLMDRLLDLIKSGVEGKAGAENKAPFEMIMRSMLLNESVYMPVMHFMIPAEVNGAKFFSEVWIDPDSEEEGRKNGGRGGRESRLLVKFDIQDVGFFDLIIFAKGSTVDIKLFYPERLTAIEKEIREGVNEILERNNLNCNSLALEKCDKPKAITEVFPKLYERKNSINVRI